MALSKEHKAVSQTDEILTDLLTEIADLDYMVRKGTFESFPNKKFWISELDKRKTRLERQLDTAEATMAGVTWPQGLKKTYNHAKERQAVTKAQLTKVQKKLLL